MVLALDSYMKSLFRVDQISIELIQQTTSPNIDLEMDDINQLMRN